MPPVMLASAPQIAATSGIYPRLSLADALRLQAPGAVAQQRAFAQDERAVAMQENALQRQQRQQRTANIISGVGTAGQLALAAKDLGLFGSGGTDTTAGTGGVAVGGTPGTAAADVGGAAAPTPGGSVSIGVPAGAGSTIGGIAGGIVGGLGGAMLGGGTPLSMVTGGILGAAGKAAGQRAGTYLEGALFGGGDPKASGFGDWGEMDLGYDPGAVSMAAFNEAAGPAVDAGVSAVADAAAAGATDAAAAGAGACLIVSATHGRNSPEAQLSRRFRDKYLNGDALKGYYLLAESMGPRMEQDEKYRETVREALVAPLLRFGSYALGDTDEPPSRQDSDVAAAFLRTIETVGRGMPHFQRSTGEMIGA